MSTILDALRKLEEEKRKSKQGKDPLQVALEPVPPPVRNPSRWPRTVVAGAGILILSVAVAGTYWLTRRTAQTAHVEKAGTEMRVVQTRPHDPALPAAPEPKGQKELEAASRMDRARASQTPASALEEPPQRIALAPRQTEPVSPFSVPAPDQPLAPEQDEPSSESGQAVPEDSDAGLVEPDVEEIGEEEILPQGPVGEDESQPEARKATALEEKGIRISAVVWNPEPSQRFAVVNLRTVHEGDEVGGRRVAEIREDGVVFLQGGERYKILLGRR